MVCERCVSVIKDGIANLGYNVTKISLGKVSVQFDLDKKDYTRIEEFLDKNGFKLISNRQIRILNQVKELINRVFEEDVRCDPKVKFSHLLSEKLHINYDSISKIFSELEGMTLEKYIITRRCEKVKELLVYTDYTLSKIAYTTGFSSIHHLSRQFKELTGLSPSHFKAIRSEKKKFADDLQH